MSIRWKRAAIWSLASVVVLVIFAKLMRPYVFPLPLDRCNSRRFDRIAWHDSSRVGLPSAVRGCMVDHLLATHDLVGLTTDSVIALLGDPPPTDYFRDADMVYWLGPERGFMSIDSEWLVFTVDARGRVTQVAVKTD